MIKTKEGILLNRIRNGAAWLGLGSIKLECQVLIQESCRSGTKGGFVPRMKAVTSATGAGRRDSGLPIGLA